MENIIILSPDGRVRVTLPRVKKIVVGGQEEATEKKMASGKLVKEVKGHRAVVRGEWDWLPTETLLALHTLLRCGGYFRVEYPDPVEGEAEGMFKVNYPDAGVFRYMDGKPRWYGASLTMTAQEVR